jgi:alpha-D-ribose 1-methylphosphonate 5-triphosphate synthase subunit PhnH
MSRLTASPTNAHRPVPAEVNRGFSAPAIDAQATFRAIMVAMAEPGTIHELVRPGGLCSSFSPAMTATALTLADFETAIWLDPVTAPDAVPYLRFHTGAPFTSNSAKAAFAFVPDATRLPRLAAFSQGTLEYPDTSTTIVIDIADIEAGRGLHLSGPGISGKRRIEIPALPDTFIADLTANRALFPCGVDLIFCHGTRITALPRSTRIEQG